VTYLKHNQQRPEEIFDHAQQRPEIFAHQKRTFKLSVNWNRLMKIGQIIFYLG